MSKPASDAPRLNTSRRGKRSRGFLKLCTYFDTKDSFLVAEIKEARCLQKAVAGYVKCYLLPDKKKTKQKTIVVKDKTTMPEFDEVLRWEVPDPRVSGTDNGMLPKGGGWGVQFETKGGGQG